MTTLSPTRPSNPDNATVPHAARRLRSAGAVEDPRITQAVTQLTEAMLDMSAEEADALATAIMARFREPATPAPEPVEQLREFRRLTGLVQRRAVAGIRDRRPVEATSPAVTRSGRAPRLATNARRRGSRRGSSGDGDPGDGDSDPEPPHQRRCLCGCCRSLDGRRPQTKFWDDACRKRYERARAGDRGAGLRNNLAALDPREALEAWSELEPADRLAVVEALGLPRDEDVLLLLIAPAFSDTGVDVGLGSGDHERGRVVA